MNKMFIVRILTSGGDADHFKQLAEDLGQLTLDATFGVVSDSHRMSFEMKAMLEDINKRLEYKVTRVFVCLDAENKLIIVSVMSVIYLHGTIIVASIYLMNYNDL